MIAGSLSRAVLSAVFVGAAGLYAVRLRGRPDRRPRVGPAVHALAALGMVAMLSRAGMAVSPLWYLLFYTACALLVAHAGLFGDQGQQVLAYWPYHTAMMAAMAAMPVLMTASSSAPAPATGGHEHHMAMGGAPGIAASTAVWATATFAVLAGAFAAATLWWFYLLVRGPQRPLPDLVMAAGMSASFALCL